MINRVWERFSAFIRMPFELEKEASFIGVDLNPDVIKLLGINTGIEPNLIQHFGIAPTPARAMVKDEIKDMPALAAALEKLVADTGIKHANLAIAIPRSVTISKVITLNKNLNKREMESRVWVEAGRYFPNLVEEIYLDFIPMHESKQDPTQLEVMLTATRKEKIHPYLELAKLADVKLVLVDVHHYALERAINSLLVPEDAERTVALVNIDSALLTMIVYEKQEMLFAHDLNFESYALRTLTTAKLSENVTDEIEEVGEDGVVTLTKRALTANPLKVALAPTLRHMMQHFNSRCHDKKIDRIILSGDYANLPGLCAYMQSELGVPAELADPFKSKKVATWLDENELHQHAAKFVLCCGLATSQLN